MEFLRSSRDNIFASTHLLVENSIRQLNNSLSLIDDKSFVKVQETESNFSQTHVYLNYKNLSSLLGENYKIGLNEKIQLSRWAEWAELDLKAKNNNLIFSGFTLAQDSSSNFLNIERTKASTFFDEHYTAI